MAEKGKMSTLVLAVDLECYICSKKIRKIILKLQGRESIQTVTYEEKINTVTISGPFDPQRLKKKLLCKAGKVIKEIKVKEEEKKPPPATKDQTKPAEPEKPKPAPAEKVKPKDQENKPIEKEKEKTKPAEPEKPNKPAELEKPKPKAPEPETNKPVAPDYHPFWPSGTVGPVVPTCCWRPCYLDEYYGGCRCPSCGMFFEWTAGPLPPAGGYRGGSSTCQFFCEEDPSCTLM